MTTTAPARFCPTCGDPVEERLLEDDHRPRLVCSNGHVSWQNPRLVVNAISVQAGRAFLGRRAIEPGVGKWGIPGGFLEMGESAQEGARREVEEETELRIEVGRLVGVYSRPPAGIVVIVFEADVVGGSPEAAVVIPYAREALRAAQ